MSSVKAPPMPAIIRSIAKANSFDPELSAISSGRIALYLDAWSEVNDLGIKLVPTKRTIEIYSRSQNDLWLVARLDKGMVGNFLSRLQRDGWLSPSPEVAEALRYRLQKQHNSAHLKWLDKKRNVHAYVLAERKQNMREEGRQRLLRVVANGQDWIDRNIVKDGSCRDVEANVSPRMPIEPRQSYMATLADLGMDDGPKRTRALKARAKIRVLAPFR
jgi:hypothetical protein